MLVSEILLNMWFKLVLLLIFNHVLNIFSATEGTNNEDLELTDLFLENLKADPVLLRNTEFNENSINYIEGKIEKFVEIISQAPNTVSPRYKRSLQQLKDDLNKDSINISANTNFIHSEYADDIRFLQQATHNSTFVAVLQNKRSLLIFQERNGTYIRNLQTNIEYTTNLGAVFVDEALLAVGENSKVIIFEFNVERLELKVVQTLFNTNPKHVVLWEQDNTAYLSITDGVNYDPKNAEELVSIKIFRWKGRHFDLVEQIQLYNIKKSVPFHIHGSYFLAAVKYKSQKDEIKSYSQIFKYEPQHLKFEPYQRLLTDSCSDIKYFTTELHGEEHHFLVVVHSVRNESSTNSEDQIHQSVVYKYEDKYFIPFQSIQTTAIEWQPIHDFKSHSALIAITKDDGLVGFQFNGWHFYETAVINDKQSRLKYEDIKALHAYSLNANQILVIACDHCKNVTNMFSVSFTYFNQIQELYSQTLSWCIDSLLEFDEPPHQSELVAVSLRGDQNEDFSEEEDQKRQIGFALSESNKTLYSIEELIKASEDEQVFVGDIEAEKVVFNNAATTLNALRCEKLNEVDSREFLENILDIHKGFVSYSLSQFDVVLVPNTINPKVINKVPKEDYLLINEDLTLESLVINGAVTFENQLSANTINDLKVDHQLLLNSDQEFSNDLFVHLIGIDNLTTPQLNRINTTNKLEPITHLKILKVNSLQVGGHINRVSVPVLDKYALKKSGHQNLEGTFSFDSLVADEMNINGGVSEHYVPDDFVMINKGYYRVNQVVKFIKEIKVNKLEILSSINHINVNDSNLDILLTDSDQVQVITIPKTLDHMVLTNPIKLRNKIKNDQMYRVNPVSLDSRPYRVTGDLVINGQGVVRKNVQMNNLKGKDVNTTLIDLLQKAIKLTDPEIPVHLTFLNSVTASNVTALRVNKIDPLNWLLESSRVPQVVEGEKIIIGDLYLQGVVNIDKVNGIDLDQLKNEILKVDGDQLVEGLVEIEEVQASRGINSEIVYFANKTWNGNVNGTNESAYTIIEGNLTTNLTKVKNLVVHGLVNEQNISETIRNVVTKNTKHKVFGLKHFKELHVKNLIIDENKSDLIQLLRDVSSNEVTLNENLDLFNNITIHNFQFEKHFNNISKENFSTIIRTKVKNEKPMTVSSDRDFGVVTVFGNVFIGDNFINGQNLSVLENDTVKVDENHHFDDVEFGETIFVEDFLILEGNMEGLDLDNIVQQNSDNITEIEDKIFNDDLIVQENLNLKTNLNGINVEAVCNASSIGYLKHLIIKGQAIFVEDPRIFNINGLNLKFLKENLWLTDKEANISGTVRFGNLTFDNNVTIKQFIDQINLEILSKNYLSKTKPQIVPATLNFNQVTFVSVATPALKIDGPINDVILDELLTTILLQNITQNFENPAFLQEVIAQELDEAGDYLVNGLDLKTEAMLYNSPNTVTGLKSIKNLNVDLLTVHHNIWIQDVDILNWLDNSLLTKGTFSVTGKKAFRKATFKKALSLRGKFNNQEFSQNTVMLVDTPQNVSGTKKFNNNDSIKFKNVHVKEMVNAVQLDKLVHNEFAKKENPVFDSPLIFNNQLTVKNLNVDQMYDNINVTDLLDNVTKLGAMENFQDTFEDLLSMSIEVEKSVKGQVSILKYLKEVFYLENVYEVFGMTDKGGIHRLLSFSFTNSTNIFSTFEWNRISGEFVHTGPNVESHLMPGFMEQVNVGEKDYLYIEHSSEESYDTYYMGNGNLLHLTNSTYLEPVAQFSRNATLLVIGFGLPGLKQSCLGFIDWNMNKFEILCDATGSHNYYVFQAIAIEGVYMAETIRFEDSLYLFLAKRESATKESCLVIFKSSVKSPEFQKIQTTYEWADLNGLSTVVINGVPHIAYSFGFQEATVDPGRVSIRRLDPTNNQFNHWQHIPIAAPAGVNFFTVSSSEKLLLVPSTDTSAPLQVLKYEGAAGFREVLKGTALHSITKLRVLSGGFLAALKEDKRTAVVLNVVVKGSHFN